MRKKKKAFDYFEAFEQQAKLACKEAEILVDAIKNYKTAEDLLEVMQRAHEVEHAGDNLSHDIHTAIARDFLPPIDREDILEVCEELDDIIDSIEGVIQRFYMYDINNIHEDALSLAEIMHKCCCALYRAMKEFEHFKKSAIKEKIIEVNDLEEEADMLYVNAIRRLHTKDKDNARRCMVWGEVYGRMESCVDDCEHVADLMMSICIRNN